MRYACPGVCESVREKRYELLRSDLFGYPYFKRLPFNGENFPFQLPRQRVEGTRCWPSEDLARHRIHTAVTGANELISVRVPVVMTSQVRADWSKNRHLLRRMFDDPDIVDDGLAEVCIFRLERKL